MTKIIIGLGNPGDIYTNSRHNLGAYFLEKLATDSSMDFNLSGWQLNKKLLAWENQGDYKDYHLRLFKPNLYMNLSGQSIRAIKRQFKQTDILIIHDDLDILLGQLKLSFNRGSGGHRGIHSIHQELKSRAFYRLRIGISPQENQNLLLKRRTSVRNFVLDNFSKKELEIINQVFLRFVDFLKVYIEFGPMTAMNLYNNK